MTSVTRPKGPLPARVYWTRRLLLLGVALAVVFGATRLLPGDDGTQPSAAPAARPAAGTPQTSGAPTSGGPTPEARTGAGTARGERAKDVSPTPKRTPLAQPEDTCADEDITVTPVVQPPAFAGSDVTVRLEITSRTTPACYWKVSARSVVLRLSSGDDRIWSSQECQGAIPSEDVVVRQGDSRRTASVDMVWSGQRSDPRCTRSTSWAKPGWYHVTAAALSGEPVDEQFELLRPVAPTITPTPSPAAKSKKRRQTGNDEKNKRDREGQERRQGQGR